MGSKAFVGAIIIGIIIGSAGTYFIIDISLIDFLLAGPNRGTNQFSNNETLKESFVESLAINDLRYTILDVRLSDYGVNGEKPLESGTFLIIKVQIENEGKTELKILGANWFVKDSEDRIFIPKTFDAVSDDENKFSIIIPPGFKIVKNIGFEIPLDSNLPKFLYVPDKPLESEPILLNQINYN